MNPVIGLEQVAMSDCGNIWRPLTQRMSFVMYFDYVRPAAHVVHVAAPYHAMIAHLPTVRYLL